MDFRVVLFDIHTPLCKLFGFSISETRLGLVCFFCNDSLGTFVRDAMCVDDGCLLTSDTTANDWILSIANGGFENLTREQ